MRSWRVTFQMFPGIHLPFLLLYVLLVLGLSFHLLDLDGVGLAAAHVQVMIAHAQLQDALVYAQSWCVKHKVLRGCGEEIKRRIQKSQQTASCSGCHECSVSMR